MFDKHRQQRRRSGNVGAAVSTALTTMVVAVAAAVNLQEDGLLQLAGMYVHACTRAMIVISQSMVQRECSAIRGMEVTKLTMCTAPSLTLHHAL